MVGIQPLGDRVLLKVLEAESKTKGGIDPIQYDSDTGEFILNAAIEDGNDPSISTYSFGLEYFHRNRLLEEEKLGGVFVKVKRKFY